MSKKKEVEAVEETEATPEAAVETAGPELAGSPEIEATEGDPRLEALQAEIDDWKRRAYQYAADLDNSRRRAARDAEEAIQRANERLLLDLLPVLENFERAIGASAQTSDVDSLRVGVEAIHRLLIDAVQRAGLERIEALGQAFDPNCHEAIMQVPAAEGQNPNEVVEEFRPGYRLRERVLRPTLVKITAG